jgi:hypothetical protein
MEILEQLATGITTSEQATAGPIPIKPTSMETTADHRSAEQVPSEAPVVDQMATEERQVPEPGQEALE